MTRARRKRVRKDRSIMIRVTDEQKRLLAAAATKSGLGLSSWMLATCLHALGACGASSPAPPDAPAVNACCELGPELAPACIGAELRPGKHCTGGSNARVICGE